MTDDIMEGSHLEFARNESYVSPVERAFERWAAKVEKALGFDLDSENTMGVCVDYAFDDFLAGVAVDTFVANAKRGDMLTA